MSLPTTICLIACHAGPADHFSTFAEDLNKKGYRVQIYAAGPALKKFQDRQVNKVEPFSLENPSEAVELAKKCAFIPIVITDVGHVFDIALQKALAAYALNAVHLAYYDNPEAYVPGGYSSVASSVMGAAKGVLFANANLSQEPLYEAPSKEVFLASKKRIGLGYYPLNQVETIAYRRSTEQKELRSSLFAQYSLTDHGQKILVYTGGNNEEYFSNALPAFLQFIEEASKEHDLTNFIVLLQQHPGAKDKNLDVTLIQDWLECQNPHIPPFLVSEFSTEDAQVIADVMLYYQTSMAPQFVLAGIPTIQVGHHTYEDILVRNALCSTVTDAQELIDALAQTNQPEANSEKIYQDLGIRSDWSSRLEEAIKNY